MSHTAPSAAPGLPQSDAQPSPRVDAARQPQRSLQPHSAEPSKNCWVLTDSAGEDHDHGDGDVMHFTDEALATRHAADYDLGHRPRQLDQPCTTVDCLCCEYTFDEDGDGRVHFATAEEIGQLLPEYGWTPAGRGWRCETCSKGPCDVEADTHG